MDLREYSIEIFTAIGVIFQDFVRYEMTVRQNIATGRVDEYDEKGIRQAAQKSRADHVIERLPGGYGQLLGRRFEGGVDLSGGEWQKLALARAYLRDAQILILDEPTASLDAPSEYEIFERFAELTECRMALLISSLLHRSHGGPHCCTGARPIVQKEVTRAFALEAFRNA